MFRVRECEYGVVGYGDGYSAQGCFTDCSCCVDRVWVGWCLDRHMDDNLIPFSYSSNHRCHVIQRFPTAFEDIFEGYLLHTLSDTISSEVSFQQLHQFIFTPQDEKQRLLRFLPPPQYSDTIPNTSNIADPQ